ncbi:MAG: FHA domain-containing protein [Anaerolineales bacterium]|nr:FHA domain-containing protein [Anaerolineales bacterium]
MALAALWQSHPAAAQTGATLHLSQLETEAFPIILGYFSARDAGGQPIAGLAIEDVQVLEDGRPLPLSQLRSVQPGLRIVLALSPSDSFAIRDSQARTRYDYVRDAIVAWAAGIPARDNYLGLVTGEGVQLEDAPLAEWSAALVELALDTSRQLGDVAPLTQAMQLAARPAPQAGAGSAIWWVTAAPSFNDLGQVAEWQQQLVEQGIPLFIWQVGSVSTFNSEASQQLRALAEGTGGAWFGFSSGEPLPSPEDYFRPFRSSYFFQYDSQLFNSGSHDIQIQMSIEDGTVVSPPLSFELSIQPPNPVVVSPPSLIQRRPSEDDPQLLTPFSRPIEVIIEFPDGIERDIQRTTLFADGERVAENSSPPFTRFSWDLSAYNSSQPVMLRVEAEDSLGLVGSSVEIPVQISVTLPPSQVQSLLGRGGPLLAVAGAALAAGALLLVLVLSGRLQPPQLGARRRGRRRPRPAAPVGVDPLSDTPLLETEWSQPTDEDGDAARERPAALLQRLNAQEADRPAEFLPIYGTETFIGRDKQNSLVVDDESVSSRHAQLSRLPEGSYLVADLGSEAGTWVNYAPISAEGSQLRDGDLLHIGRVAFRFLINEGSRDPL